MANDFSSIPVGDIQFLDNLIPALAAGNYTIAVAQTLSGINTGDIGTTQKFVVAAPQVSIDPTDVNTTYPPQNLTGQYGDVLPHIVLNLALLPWERPLDGNDTSIPWMALLICAPEELAGPSTLPTKANATTVAAYTSAPAANIFRPTITLDGDVMGTNAMNTVQIPITLFNQIAPHKDELKYLAHVRALNMGDKAVDGLTGTGVYSVVVANRFPQASASDPLGQQNIAHLVSLEGMKAYLTGSANFGAGKDTLELISLYSWTFRTLPDPNADFQGLMQAMVAAEGSVGGQDPSALWMRLDSSTLAAGEAQNRIAAGYVPLNYLTRTGEKTYAWYRGPFAPFLPSTFVTPGAFPTADAAIVYDAENGLFDLSLAASWQVGRAMALADKSFGANLLSLRRKASMVVDRIQYAGTMMPMQARAQLAAGQGNLLNQPFDLLLLKNLLTAVGEPANAVHGGSDGAPSTTMLGIQGSVEGGVLNGLRSLMVDPDVQAAVSAATAAELNQVVNWLGRLSMLYGVPFNNIVADARLLPEESLRFFYLDANWMTALRDGALSIAQHSSRDTYYSQSTRSLIDAGIDQAMATYRSTLLGEDSEPGTDGITHVSGFVMRSAIVSGWPGLSVQGLDAAGNALKVLRQDHVSDDVLLVLFWGSPTKLLLTEPQEGFRFGVNQVGQIELRSLTQGDALGDPVGELHIRNMDGADGYCMRTDTQGRVLNINPSDGTSLIKSIAQAIGVAESAVGPAAFALQMVNAPMRQTFDPPN
jgi:hypothetical protein